MKTQINNVEHLVLYQYMIDLSLTLVTALYGLPGILMMASTVLRPLLPVLVPGHISGALAVVITLRCAFHHRHQLRLVQRQEVVIDACERAVVDPPSGSPRFSGMWLSPVSHFKMIIWMPLSKIGIKFHFFVDYCRPRG